MNPNRGVLLRPRARFVPWKQYVLGFALVVVGGFFGCVAFIFAIIGYFIDDWRWAGGGSVALCVSGWIVTRGLRIGW